MKNLGPLLIALFLVLSFIGFLDATFLTIEHYRGVVPPCSVLEGCEAVTTSQYATIGDVPVALFGSIYYLSLFLFGIAYVDSKNKKIINFAARLTLVGFLASLWFLYLQVFVIKALCLYCLVSVLTSTLLFIVGLIILKLQWISVKK